MAAVVAPASPLSLGSELPACGAVADLREGLTSMRAPTAGRDSKSATGIEVPHPSNRPPRGADAWSAGLVRGGLETGHAVWASGGLVHL
jgi:hypothetical protein